jgi:hypothetical protein
MMLLLGIGTALLGWALWYKRPTAYRVEMAVLFILSAGELVRYWQTSQFQPAILFCSLVFLVYLNRPSIRMFFRTV